MLPAGFVPGAGRTIGDVAEAVDRGPWTVERMPVPAVVVPRLGVDQRWQGRGLGVSLIWPALELVAAVATAVRARRVVAHGETEPASGSLGRFRSRVSDSEKGSCYLPMPDVEATVSARATPPQTTTTATGGPKPDR